MESRLVNLTVKTYLREYCNGANKSPGCFFEQGYGEIADLPFEVRQAIATIETEEKEF